MPEFYNKESSNGGSLQIDATPPSAGLALIHLRCQPINQRWHRIVGQVIQKLRHRINSLPTGRASRNNYAFSAMRDRWRLIYEV